MEGLALSQKNAILLVAHEQFRKNGTADNAINALADLLTLDAGLIRGYLEELYDLDALFATRKPEEPVEEIPKVAEPTEGVEGSTEEQVDSAEERDVVVQSGPQSPMRSKTERSATTETVAADERGEEDRGARSRRTSSAAELLVTPVKRARRR